MICVMLKACFSNMRNVRGDSMDKKEEVIKRVVEKAENMDLGEYSDDFWNRLTGAIEDFKRDRSRRVILDEVEYLISDLFKEAMEEVGYEDRIS